MNVRMLIGISGFRDGVAWPAPGGTIDVPDHEAADLIRNGYAEEATDDGTPAADDQPQATDDDGQAPAGDDVQAASTRPTGRRK